MWPTARPPRNKCTRLALLVARPSRLFSVFCSVCFFYCVFAGARRVIRWHSFGGIRLTQFLRCPWCTRSVTQLAQPIKTDGFWRQPQNNWSTIHSREVKSNPYAAAVANLEKHS
jgi:hypothetical protein